jgi:hypothetical protein
MNNNIYETKDLYIAAYLIAIGHSLKSHSRYDGEIYFVFDNNENIQQEVNKFISRKALVDPVAYSQSMKSLKSVLYAIKTGNGNNNYGNHIR